MSAPTYSPDSPEVGAAVSLADPETWARGWVGTVTKVTVVETGSRVVVLWDHEECRRGYNQHALAPSRRPGKGSP